MRAQAAKRSRHGAGRNSATRKQAARCVVVALDESDAAAVKRRLESALNEGRHIEIDAGALPALTTAGIQVLLAAAADAGARHLQFRLTGDAASIIALFGGLGFSDKIATWLDPARNRLSGRVAET